MNQGITAYSLSIQGPTVHRFQTASYWDLFGFDPCHERTSAQTSMNGDPPENLFRWYVIFWGATEKDYFRSFADAHVLQERNVCCRISYLTRRNGCVWWDVPAQRMAYLFGYLWWLLPCDKFFWIACSGMFMPREVSALISSRYVHRENRKNISFWDIGLHYWFIIVLRIGLIL